MRTNETRAEERGAIAVEFALLSIFLLFPLLIGVTDFGQIIHARYILTQAAREGAMTASRGQDPASAVRQYLSRAGLDTSKATITPSGTGGGLGTQVSVRVTYNLTGMPLIPWENMIKGLATLEASAFARHM